MIEPNEALLLFTKWFDEKTPLRVLVELHEVTFTADCSVLALKGIGGVYTIALRLSELDMCEFVLGDCSFEYGEPRTFADRAEVIGGHTFSSVLIALRPSGERFIFMEIAS